MNVKLNFCLGSAAVVLAPFHVQSAHSESGLILTLWGLMRLSGGVEPETRDGSG